MRVNVQNTYTADFCDTASRRYNRDTADMTHGQWMCKNTSLNKKPFSFTRYPFQEQIANDMHPNLDCIKPSQVGLTEIQIRKALTILTRTPNTSLIYTMPNERMFKRISKARIQPLMNYDKAFKLDKGDSTKQSMDLMRVGSSFMYVTGSSEADATSINADYVFNDEIDLTDSSMLALFNSRLQGSDHRVSQRFSTPTFEGFGVDRGFARSDQHEYVIKCSSCNHHQIPLFTPEFVHVDGMPDIDDFINLQESLVDAGKVKIETAYVFCEKCRKPLDLSDYSSREWVAKFPSRTLNRGYRVRTFSSHRLDPVYCFTQMFKYLEKDNIKGFKNTVLGDAYTNADQKMTEQQIDLVLLQDSVPEPLPEGQYFLGIDIGATCYITVGDIRGPKDCDVVLFQTCTADALPNIVKVLDEKYKFINGGLDRYPYTPTVNDIREASNGKLMPVHYGGRKVVAEVKDAGGEVDYLTVNRTSMLDKVANGVRNATMRFRGFTQYKDSIKIHLQDMVREEKEEQEPIWIKLNGNDHFFHSLGYMWAAYEYRQLLIELGGHKNMTAGFSTPSAGSVVLGQPVQQDFFGTSTLIGYAQTPSNDKIIRSNRK